MLHKRNLDDLVSLAITPMNLPENVGVEIYRSLDKRITGKYFGENRELPAEFELVVFSFEFGNNPVFVRYPDTNFYIQLYGGFGSSRGSMTHGRPRNIIAEKVNPFVYEGKLQANRDEIYKHDSYAMYTFSSTDFNFLERVALINNRDYSNPEYRNYGQDYVNEMLRRNCILIPMEKTIAYSFITEDGNIVLVDQNTYDFQYETMRCFYGNIKDGIRQGTINKFARYRDGGTTHFELNIDLKIHKFFCPTSLGQKGQEKVATWNDVPMTKMPESMLKTIVELLGINLAPEVEDKR